MGLGFEQVRGLPLPSRTALLSAVASVLPYYTPSPAELPGLLTKFPPPSPVAPTSRRSFNLIAIASPPAAPAAEAEAEVAAAATASVTDVNTLAAATPPLASGLADLDAPPQLSQQQQQQREAHLKSEERQSTWAPPGAGTEFVITEITDTFGKIRCVATAGQVRVGASWAGAKVGLGQGWAGAEFVIIKITDTLGKIRCVAGAGQRRVWARIGRVDLSSLRSRIRLARSGV